MVEKLKTEVISFIDKTFNYFNGKINTNNPNICYKIKEEKVYSKYTNNIKQATSYFGYVIYYINPIKMKLQIIKN